MLAAVGGLGIPLFPPTIGTAAVLGLPEPTNILAALSDIFLLELLFKPLRLFYDYLPIEFFKIPL